MGPRLIVHSALSEQKLRAQLQILDDGPDLLRPRIVGRRPRSHLWRIELGAGLAPVGPHIPQFLGRLRERGIPGARDRVIKPIPLRSVEGQPPSLHAFTARGEGATIAVIDPHGVIPHDTFGDRLETFVFREATSEYAPGEHVFEPGKGHGTAVASVAAGATVGSPAPLARVVGYKSEWVWEMMCAIDHAMTRDDVCIVCLACELPRRGFQEEDQLSDTMDDARNKGIFILAAGGNEGSSGKIGEPASLPSVFAVGGFADGIGGTSGAADGGDKVSVHSSRGRDSTKPDFLEYYGAYLFAVAGGADDRSEGTSLAVGRAAGAIATLYGKRGGREAVTINEVEALVKQCCIPLVDENGAPYPASAQGHGAFDEAMFEQSL